MSIPVPPEEASQHFKFTRQRGVVERTPTHYTPTLYEDEARKMHEQDVFASHGSSIFVKGILDPTPYHERRAKAPIPPPHIRDHTVKKKHVMPMTEKEILQKLDGPMPMSPSPMRGGRRSPSPSCASPNLAFEREDKQRVIDALSGSGVETLADRLPLEHCEQPKGRRRFTENEQFAMDVGINGFKGIGLHENKHQHVGGKKVVDYVSIMDGHGRKTSTGLVDGFKGLGEVSELHGGERKQGIRLRQNMPKSVFDPLKFKS